MVAGMLPQGSATGSQDCLESAGQPSSWSLSGSSSSSQGSLSTVLQAFNCSDEAHPLIKHNLLGLSTDGDVNHSYKVSSQQHVDSCG